MRFLFQKRRLDLFGKVPSWLVRRIFQLKIKHIPDFRDSGSWLIAAVVPNSISDVPSGIR